MVKQVYAATTVSLVVVTDERSVDDPIVLVDTLRIRNALRKDGVNPIYLNALTVYFEGVIYERSIWRFKEHNEKKYVRRSVFVNLPNQEKERYVELHRCFDELLASFLAHTNKIPSDVTAIELMQWSHDRAF